MKAQLLTRVAGIIILFMAMLTYAAHGQTGEAEVGAENAEPLGRRVWPAVTNGLVFINGEYIPPPYTVSRDKHFILINDRLIEQGPPWPWPKSLPPPPIPKTEPIMPTSISEKTTIYDDDYLRFVTDSRLYLFDKYGQEKGMDKLIEVIKKLPFVSSASRKAGSPTGVDLILKSGEKSSGDLVGPERKAMVVTKEWVRQSMDRNCDIYVNGLANNNCFMFGNTTRRLTPAGFGQALTPLVEAMRAAKDESEFLSITKTNQPPGRMSEAAFRSFYKHKVDLPKWELRIRAATE